MCLGQKCQRREGWENWCLLEEHQTVSQPEKRYEAGGSWKREEGEDGEEEEEEEVVVRRRSRRRKSRRRRRRTMMMRRRRRRGGGGGREWGWWIRLKRWGMTKRREERKSKERREGLWANQLWPCTGYRLCAMTSTYDSAGWMAMHLTSKFPIWFSSASTVKRFNRWTSVYMTFERLSK